MALVAVTAVLLGVFSARVARFQRIAGRHADQVKTLYKHEMYDLSNKSVIFSYMNGGPLYSASSNDWREAEAARVGRRRSYHDRLQRKYEQAARRPWLPVAPDPPDPAEASSLAGETSDPTIRVLENEYLLQTLAFTRGDREEAAWLLGIDRRTLDRRLAESTIAPAAGLPARSASE
ncbi:MAG TPA: helix-turn-helix domain-containing protein [Isosphaeraceae bacterium]|jgi:hypothetical protein|nr:helix-turn-helix domain-containing protein [Isosphaeraceae bacterium]